MDFNVHSIREFYKISGRSLLLTINVVHANNYREIGKSLKIKKTITCTYNNVLITKLFITKEDLRGFLSQACTY